MKAILDIEVPCQVSGLKLNGSACDFHKIPLILLDNGTLMSYCPNHRARFFISDRTTVHMIMRTANIVERIEKPIKERKHGTT